MIKQLFIRKFPRLTTMLSLIKQSFKSPNLQLYDPTTQFIVPAGQGIYDPDIFGLYDLKTQKIVSKESPICQKLDLDIIREDMKRYIKNIPFSLISDRYDLVLSQLIPGNGICIDACTGSPEERVKLRIKQLGYDYLPIDLHGDGSSIKIEDLTNLSFIDESISLIISLDTLEHIENYVKALSELYRVLKIGGLTIIHVPCYYFSREDSQSISPEKDPWGHVRYFSAIELIKNMIGVGFIILRISYHLDYGAIQIIATKQFINIS